MYRLIFVSLALLACANLEGPRGPQGEQGEQGAIGTDVFRLFTFFNVSSG